MISFVILDVVTFRHETQKAPPLWNPTSGSPPQPKMVENKDPMRCLISPAFIARVEPIDQNGNMNKGRCTITTSLNEKLLVKHTFEEICNILNDDAVDLPPKASC